MAVPKVTGPNGAHASPQLPDGDLPLGHDVRQVGAHLGGKPHGCNLAGDPPERAGRPDQPSSLEPGSLSSPARFPRASRLHPSCGRLSPTVGHVGGGSPRSPFPSWELSCAGQSRTGTAVGPRNTLDFARHPPNLSPRPRTPHSQTRERIACRRFTSSVFPTPDGPSKRNIPPVAPARKVTGFRAAYPLPGSGDTPPWLLIGSRGSRDLCTVLSTHSVWHGEPRLPTAG